MAILKFNRDDVLRVIRHAMAAPEHSRGYGDNQPARPCLILVHDQGVYLMSNGTPRDLRAEGSDSSFAAYAKGMDPDKDEGWWERARNAVGGDDFGEYLEITPELAEDIENGGVLSIRITSTQIAILTDFPSAGVSRAELEAHIKKQMAKGTCIYRSGRDKIMRIVPPQHSLAEIKRMWPRAVVLSPDNMTAAVEEYARRKGYKLLASA